MGRSRRSRPAKLGKKLKQIRMGLGLTQAEMADKVKVKGEAIMLPVFRNMKEDCANLRW